MTSIPSSFAPSPEPKDSGGACLAHEQPALNDPAAVSQSARALWLFRNGIPLTRPGVGLDTVEIARALKTSEAEAVRMLNMARFLERGCA